MVAKMSLAVRRGLISTMNLSSSFCTSACSGASNGSSLKVSSFTGGVDSLTGEDDSFDGGVGGGSGVLSLGRAGMGPLRLSALISANRLGASPLWTQGETVSLTVYRKLNCLFCSNKEKQTQIAACK